MQTRYSRNINQPRQSPKRVSDERFQDVMESVYGVKIPKAEPFESEDEQKFAGALENVYGIKLPSEMVARAYSIFIKERNQSERS